MRTAAAVPLTSSIRSIRLRDLVELSKLRITGMVAISTAVGMLLAAEGPLPWLLCLHVLVGTSLVAAGAGALNQIIERDIDRRMPRTAKRPIPDGRLHPDLALLYAVGMAIVGLLELALFTRLEAALVAAATLVGYVFVYTPLKRLSSLATVVGAVPGALPPVIGWVAVTGELATGAWALFALLFFWQMPHFLAIAWLYREDYARGGLPMLSVHDPQGLRTASQSVLYCAALVPVSLLPTALELSGGLYFAGALLLGAVFFAASCAFALRRDLLRARRLMLVSVLYLPAVLAVLVVDRLLG